MAQSQTDDELVVLDPDALDSAPCGQEFQGSDYYILFILGLFVPLALLAWGWL